MTAETAATVVTPVAQAAPAEAVAETVVTPVAETAAETVVTPLAETEAETIVAPVAEASQQPYPSPEAAQFGAPQYPMDGAQYPMGGPQFPMGVPFAPPPKPKRPFPWRWLGAVVAAAAVGAGCAFAVMAPKRTDLPGLRTASDGRYVFAPLSLPTLAPGQLAPGDVKNSGGQHLSDIRKLLLAAPQGAQADHAVKLTDGWLSKSDSLKLTRSPSAQLDFGQYGWRHTAAESWTTQDGAETKIYLLQFSSGRAAGASMVTFGEIAGVPDDAKSATLEISGVLVTYYKVAHGKSTTWYSTVAMHDTVLEIVYTAPSSVGLAPFQQEVGLQLELLE